MKVEGAEKVKKLRIGLLLLTLIPGMGHLWEGRDFKGLLLFSLFAACAAGVLEGALLWSGPGRTEILVMSSLGLVAVWGYAFFDIFRFAYEPLRERDRYRRSEHLREGILCFLRGDYERAEKEFLANIRLNPGDPESLFRLAVLCRVRGDLPRAKRYLRALRRNDLEEKWRWESAQEEELISALENKAQGKVTEKTSEEVAQTAI